MTGSRVTAIHLVNHGAASLRRCAQSCATCACSIGARVLDGAVRMALPTLSPAEAALLLEVRLSDEDHGGLSGAELSTDEYDAMRRLCDLGLVEAVGEYGEAPDGEEDEREAGESAVVYRITGAGVHALADSGPPESGRP